MADESVVVPAAGGAGDGGGSGGGADISSLSDSEALEQTLGASDDAAGAAPGAEKVPSGAPKEADAPAEDINLAALEEGQPEWLGKVTDPAAKAEIDKLIARDKKFAEKFKDEADLDEFFKELPGGREQIAALQTLSKETAELDTALETNTPEGNATVVERYLSMTPDGGVGLIRAAAQHMAKSSPESWNTVASELVNSTLAANGIGADLPGLLGAISEMKAAVAADDGEAFAKASQKLLGTPQASGPKVDPAISRAQEAERAARTAERTAKVQVWESNVASSIGAVQQSLRQSIGTALAAKDSQGKPLIPASIPEKSRGDLMDRIYKEVDNQLGSDAWLVSQISQLVGSRTGNKQNLEAAKEHFDKAAEMSKAAAARLLPAAVRKHVSAWARELASSSQEAIARAKGISKAPSKEVGGRTPNSKGPRRLNQDDVIGENAKSDKELLEMSLGL